VRDALPLDMVVLGLHGGMMAIGYDDCEGDLLTRLRDIVGPRCVVGAELDPHGTITPAMLGAADILVCYKETPHTDFLERAEELVEMAVQAANGRTRPVMSVFDCRMILSSPTNREPLAGFVRRIKALEGRDGVLSISIGHCFALADLPETTYKVLVVTDDRKAQGDVLAERLGRELYAMRAEIALRFVTIESALDTALASPAGPVVIADSADNPGAGSPGDSTFILKLLMARGASSACIGPLWDPVAVRMCFSAGVGAQLPLRFGAKMGPHSGEPVDAVVTVTALARDATQSFGDAIDPLGDAAAIRIGGIDIVLCSIRTQALGTDLFTGMGIDPRARHVVVVKSHNHFHAAFGPIAAGVIRAAAPGPSPIDYATATYRRVRRPIWPLDPDPLGAG
jgi:microcystin degradation protein MlrC